jgi:hypothetical protein
LGLGCAVAITVTSSAWWFLPAIGFGLAAFVARRPARGRNRFRRDFRGLRVKCGYDLRTSPDRCPECGTPREMP